MLFWGFETGTANSLTGSGWSVSGSTSTSERHRDLYSNGGNYSLNLTNQQGATSPQYAVDAYRWCSVAIHVPSSSSSGINIEFRKSGSSQFACRIGTDRKVYLYRGAYNGTNVATSTGTLLPGWHWIEIEMNAKNSSGACNVYVDKGTSAYVSFSGDCAALAGDNWDQISIFNDWLPAVYYVDDLVLTSAAEGRLADEVFIAMVVPNGDSAVTFTRSTGATNWGTVDEVPPSTTDYNESTVAGNADLYNLTDLPFTPSTVYGVKVIALVARDGTLTTWKNSVKSGSTTNTSSAYALSGAGAYVTVETVWTQNPDTSSAWTASTVNSLIAGGQFD